MAARLRQLETKTLSSTHTTNVEIAADLTAERTNRMIPVTVTKTEAAPFKDLVALATPRKHQDHVTSARSIRGFTSNENHTHVAVNNDINDEGDSGGDRGNDNAKSVCDGVSDSVSASAADSAGDGEMAAEALWQQRLRLMRATHEKIELDLHARRVRALQRALREHVNARANDIHNSSANAGAVVARRGGAALGRAPGGFHVMGMTAHGHTADSYYGRSGGTQALVVPAGPGRVAVHSSLLQAHQ